MSEPAATADVALTVAERGGRLLVARRSDDAHLGGTWEFPGGKVEDGEDPADAARRELREETRLVAVGLEPLAVFVHEYPDRTLRFHVYIARDPQGEERLDGGREFAWRAYPDLLELEMPPANRQILAALRWRLAR